MRFYRIYRYAAATTFRKQCFVVLVSIRKVTIHVRSSQSHQSPTSNSRIASLTKNRVSAYSWYADSPFRNCFRRSKFQGGRSPIPCSKVIAEIQASHRNASRHCGMSNPEHSPTGRMPCSHSSRNQLSFQRHTCSETPN